MDDGSNESIDIFQEVWTPLYNIHRYMYFILCIKLRDTINNKKQKTPWNTLEHPVHISMVSLADRFIICLYRNTFYLNISDIIVC